MKDYMIKVSMEIQVCDEESFENAKAWVQDNILDDIPNYEFEIEEI